MRQTLLFSILALLHWSCTEEFFNSKLDYFVESPDSRLVVHAALSPGETPVVEVSYSIPVFGIEQTPYNLPNAKVLMYEDGLLWDSLSYQSFGFETGVFASTKPVERAKSYSISVRHTNFEEATAVAQVPEPVAPSQLSWVQPGGMDVRMTLPGLPPERYYYLSFTATESMGWEEKIYFSSNSPFLEFDSDAGVDLGDGDEIFEWAYVRPDIMGGSSKEIVVSFSPSFFIPDTVFLDLYILEEDLFKQGIGLNAFEIGNPFAEPEQIHSNIVNGYGVFSAYALTRTEVQ